MYNHKCLTKFCNSTNKHNTLFLFFVFFLNQKKLTIRFSFPQFCSPNPNYNNPNAKIWLVFQKLQYYSWTNATCPVWVNEWLSVFRMSAQIWPLRHAPAGMRMTVDIPAHATLTGRARPLPPHTAPSAASAQSATVRGETGVNLFSRASVINAEGYLCWHGLCCQKEY